MFTGIGHAVATILSATTRGGIRTFLIAFPPGFCEGLAIGGSVAVNGVCLTATSFPSPDIVAFDVISESLRVTTLNGYGAGMTVNVERAARDGAEIGGHPISGHVDFHAPVVRVRTMDANKAIRIGLPPVFAWYVFSKGYIAIDGASLTVAQVDHDAGWFEIWLIPETRRVTNFDRKNIGDDVNVEIERNTQVVVDTLRSAVEEKLGSLLPLPEESSPNVVFGWTRCCFRLLCRHWRRRSGPETRTNR